MEQWCGGGIPRARGQDPVWQQEEAPAPLRRSGPFISQGGPWWRFFELLYAPTDPSAGGDPGMCALCNKQANKSN